MVNRGTYTYAIFHRSCLKLRHPGLELLIFRAQLRYLSLQGVILSLELHSLLRRNALPPNRAESDWGMRETATRNIPTEADIRPQDGGGCRSAGAVRTSARVTTGGQVGV